jgi:hypothetical protein
MKIETALLLPVASVVASGLLLVAGKTRVFEAIALVASVVWLLADLGRLAEPRSRCDAIDNRRARLLADRQQARGHRLDRPRDPGRGSGRRRPQLISDGRAGRGDRIFIVVDLESRTANAAARATDSGV